MDPLPNDEEDRLRVPISEDYLRSLYETYIRELTHGVCLTYTQWRANYVRRFLEK